MILGNDNWTKWETLWKSFTDIGYILGEIVEPNQDHHIIQDKQGNYRKEMVVLWN